ncbi:hypothetical protein [Gluconacetobacter tumulicola]|uniref:hypothetical protein n=1 Tax=Gluconacetobacter tumulicola TaxID=1017177 RepID=UPI001C81A68B|nr:hypothetical protein [Gluconacetobacter tumulicola]
MMSGMEMWERLQARATSRIVSIAAAPTPGVSGTGNDPQSSANRFANLQTSWALTY